MAERGDGRGASWSPSPASGKPARGYAWPPFEPGNTAALRHGARSPRRLRPLAERLEAEIVEAAPWVARPAFRQTLRSLAWVEAELELRRAWADDQGLIDEDGNPLKGDDRRDRAEARAQKLRAALGLDPTSYARLLATVSGVLRGGGLEPDDADLLARLEAEGRQILESRARRLPEPEHENGAQRPQDG